MYRKIMLTMVQLPLGRRASKNRDAQEKLYRTEWKTQKKIKAGPIYKLISKFMDSQSYELMRNLKSSVSECRTPIFISHSMFNLLGNDEIILIVKLLYINSSACLSFDLTILLISRQLHWGGNHGIASRSQMTTASQGVRPNSKKIWVRLNTTYTEVHYQQFCNSDTIIACSIVPDFRACARK